MSTDIDEAQESCAYTFLLECRATNKKDDNFVCEDPSLNLEGHFIEFAYRVRSAKKGTASSLLRLANSIIVKSRLENPLHISPVYLICSLLSTQGNQGKMQC